MAVAFRIPALIAPDDEQLRRQRPQLSVVAPTKRRYMRVLSVVVAFSVALGLVVTLRVYMAQQQLKIDRMNYDISRARLHFDALRAERASLQSPEVLIQRAREMGMVQSVGTKIVEIPASVAADVAANVGSIDADVVDGIESPLDEFGRLKPSVVGAP